MAPKRARGSKRNTKKLLLCLLYMFMDVKSGFCRHRSESLTHVGTDRYKSGLSLHKSGLGLRKSGLIVISRY